MAMLASIAIGFFLPNEYVRMMARRRQKQLRRGLPNALDLMVVSVESGLGLDQAVVQVAKELEHAHPGDQPGIRADESGIEGRQAPHRGAAKSGRTDRRGRFEKAHGRIDPSRPLRNLIAATLRNHAEYMRLQTRQVAEEKAAKLGVKLVFPIFFCIMPTLFVVTVGPMAVKVVRELLPMIQNM